MARTLKVGALALVSGALGAVLALGVADHNQRARVADFRATCTAVGGTLRNLEPSKVVDGLTEGQPIGVRVSVPASICFK